MQAKATQYPTPAEYLKSERVAEAKSEYYKGRIFDFAGGSENHSLFSVNLASQLNLALAEKPCKVYGSDMRAWLETEKTFVYPDISVVCKTPQFYDKYRDSLMNPLLIIEILSKSTRQHDREGKFRLYRSLPSFQEYVLVDQYAMYVEQFWKTAANEWHLRIL